MKKINLLLVFCLAALAFAQAQIPPEAFNYSAVARDANAQPISNSAIEIQISILESSATGTAVYLENHTVNTDDFGLFNLVVGGGEVQGGTMTAIDWSNDNYYLKIGMDTNGGADFLTMGTTQLLSVPYALHAKTAESITGNGSNSSRYVGELYGGGVVFWVDQTGQHGLILSMVDLSASQAWSNITDAIVGTTNEWDGTTNTTEIIAQSGHTNSAAQLCVNYTNDDYGTGVYSDWYLPSVAELNHISNSYYEIQKALDSDGNSETTPLADDSYWSSSERNPFNAAWCFRFMGGSASTSKSNEFHVRAVRAF